MFPNPIQVIGSHSDWSDVIIPGTILCVGLANERQNYTAVSAV